jgi:hypothetical protein
MKTRSFVFGGRLLPIIRNKALPRRKTVLVRANLNVGARADRGDIGFSKTLSADTNREQKQIIKNKELLC